MKGNTSTKDLLLHQTFLAYEGDPEMSLKASLRGVTDEVASRRLVNESWTIEEIVYHVASCKIEYCKQGFGCWEGDYDKPWGDFAAVVRLLDCAQEHLVSCLQGCSETDLAKPLPMRFHGESAAHFFTVMLTHDIAHAGQISTRLRVFGVRTGGYHAL